MAQRVNEQMGTDPTHHFKDEGGKMKDEWF
jgi:hypothetical protein